MKIWEAIREWGALLGLIFFLGAGLAYAHYHDSNKASRELREANVHACQRGVAKAQIFKAFTDTASSARRASAAAEAAQGNKILAQNDIAAAKVYESLGVAWMELTPTDCQSQYPNIP